MICQDLKYSNDHEWVRVLDGDIAEIGISDFAVNELGDIVYVELPAEGATVTAGQEFGSVESVKTVSPILAPVSGSVVAVNPVLCEDNGEYTPEIVNADAYGAGWMIRVKMSNPAELNDLMDDKAYAQIIEAGH